MKKIIIISSLIAFVFSGCSTMFNDKAQAVKISSNDKDVKVLIFTSNGTYRTKLPATMSIEPSNCGVNIIVIDPCYENTTIKVNRHITPSYWANIFNYGIGFIIDFANGNMWRYDENTSIPLIKKQNCSL